MKLLFTVGISAQEDSPQPVSLGNLRGSRYRIHLVAPDGKPNDVIWIGGKRTPKPHGDRVIVVSVTLGGSSTDVAEYEGELNAVVRSWKWLDSPTGTAAEQRHAPDRRHEDCYQLSESWGGG